MNRGTLGVYVACANLVLTAGCVPVDDRVLRSPDGEADGSTHNAGADAADGPANPDGLGHAGLADASASDIAEQLVADATDAAFAVDGAISFADDAGATAVDAALGATQAASTVAEAGTYSIETDTPVTEAGTPTTSPEPAKNDGAAPVGDATLSADSDASECDPDSIAPLTPVLLSPTIGAYTGSIHADSSDDSVNPPLRPRFTWQSVGGCRVTYDIELDSSCAANNYRSCTFASPVVRASDLSSTSYQPTAPLPATALAGQGVGRRYYWRVRACDARERCSAWSTPRYVEVGRLRDDVNGDGYSDAVTATQGGNPPWDSLYIYFGGASGDAARPLDGTCDALIPSVSRPEPAPGINHLPNNRWVSLVDVNADGYADIVVTQSSYEVELYLGGPDLSTTFPCDGQSTGSPALWLTGLGQDNFGYAISAAGDLDADGYADFAITAPALDGKTAPSVHVFFGSKTMSAISASRLSLSNADAKGTTQFGLDVAGVGDWNLDAYPDLIILSNSLAYWLKGSDTRTGVAANARMLTEFEAHQANRLCRAGDVDGDGFADVAFASGSIAFWISPGGPQAPGPLLEYTDSEPVTRFFYDCGGDYDTNSDSLPDLWFFTRMGGATHVSSFLGSTPLPADHSGVPIGEVVRANQGGFLDYNGDGIADIFIGDTLAEHKLWLSPTLSVQSALRLTLPTSVQPLGILAR